MDLAITLLSCGRLEYLRQTVAAARSHFDQIESVLNVQWLCFDNGSPYAHRTELHQFGFDLLAFSSTNLGIGPAMNRLMAAVRAPYVLNLQDDWVLENSAGLHFVREAIRIMESDSRIAHVKLDAHHFLDFHDRSIYAGPFSAPGGTVSYHVQNPQMTWGSFCFPPGITRTAALHEIGPFREDNPFQRGWAETEYSARFGRKYHAAKSPEMCLFRHIGEQNGGRSSRPAFRAPRTRDVANPPWPGAGNLPPPRASNGA